MSENRVEAALDNEGLRFAVGDQVAVPFDNDKEDSGFVYGKVLASDPHALDGEVVYRVQVGAEEGDEHEFAEDELRSAFKFVVGDNVLVNLDVPQKEVQIINRPAVVTDMDPFLDGEDKGHYPYTVRYEDGSTEETAQHELSLPPPA